MRCSSLIRSSILLVLLCPALVAAAETDTDLFQSPTARIEVRKPSGWHFQSIETVLESRASVKFNDEEFRRVVEQLANGPLVVATKYEEPYENLNPTFQVGIRPARSLEGMTGEEIIRLIEPTLRAQFPDFEAVGGLRVTSVSGQKAARMTYRYTLRIENVGEFPVQATIIIVPRGKVLYQFAFSGPVEGPDALADEIEKTLATVKFTD